MKDYETPEIHAREILKPYLVYASLTEPNETSNVALRYGCAIPTTVQVEEIRVAPKNWNPQLRSRAELLGFDVLDSQPAEVKNYREACIRLRRIKKEQL